MMYEPATSSQPKSVMENLEARSRLKERKLSHSLGDSMRFGKFAGNSKSSEDVPDLKLTAIDDDGRKGEDGGRKVEGR